MSVEFTSVDAGNAELVGELTFATAADALVAGCRWLEGGEGSARINCAGLRRADSAGLAVLLEWLEAATRLKRDLAFANLPESVQHLAEISEVASWLTPPLSR